MMAPVFITQIKEGEDSLLSEQIHSLNLKDTTSMSTMTTNTYFPAETTKLTMMASNKNMDDKVFPLEVYLTVTIGATSSTPDSCTPPLNPVSYSKSMLTKLNSIMEPHAIRIRNFYWQWHMTLSIQNLVFH